MIQRALFEKMQNHFCSYFWTVFAPFRFPENYETYKKGGEKEKRRKYGHCGDQYHGQTITPKDREENCKPWSTMCSKCQKVHHFAKM